MDRASVRITDETRPARSGALAVDDSGRIVLRASRALGDALSAAVDDAAVDLRPLRFDDRRRGLALTASLANGVPAMLVECETVAGALELRAYVNRGWVRLTVRPGDFDPDAAWDFLLAANEARLEASRA
jgi:hypothetical protein